MFEYVAAPTPSPGSSGDVSEDLLDDLSPTSGDGLDAELARLLDDDPVPDWVPDWVDDAAPSPTYGTCTPSGWSALELDTGTADPDALTDTELIEAMVGFERITSWAGARQARLFAAFARRRPTDTAPHTARNACVGSEFAPDEVGVALHLSRGTASARIGLAQRLLRVLPDTHALWEAGRIDLPKARAIDEATHVLSDENATKVEARVLPRAPEQTLAQLKAALARAVIAVDPDGADARHKEARKDRRVYVQPEADGMGSLWALLTATDAQGAYTWLTRLAKGLGPDDPRSMDTRRADILAALLNGRLVTEDEITVVDTGDTGDTDPTSGTGAEADAPAGPGAPADSGAAAGSDGDIAGGTVGAGPRRVLRPVTPGKPLIQVVIPHSTLIGADDQPADLAGYGPIPAALAREVAADAVWRRIVTDPLSGTVLDYGRTTYHPPAGLADLVRVRDQYCRFPGCRRRAADAELDHLVAWADGGTTCEKNLDALCLHDHRLKHHAGWRVEAHPDGRLTWITPTGQRHTTAPHDHGPEPPVTGDADSGAPAPAAATAPTDDVDTTATADPDPPPF